MRIGGLKEIWLSFWLSLYGNIANLVSLFRIVCAPVIVIMMGYALYQFAGYGRTVWPREYSFFLFYLYLAAVLSDALDGFLARFFMIFSRWGSFLDRVADKLLVVPSILLMTLYYLILAFWFVSFYAFPIAGLLLTAIYLEYLLMKWGLRGFKKKAPVNSNWRGKTKMILQCLSNLYWTLGLLFPDSKADLLGTSWILDPRTDFNLAVQLVLLIGAVGFAFGSIAGYKALPEYKEMLGNS